MVGELRLVGQGGASRTNDKRGEGLLDHLTREKRHSLFLRSESGEAVKKGREASSSPSVGSRILKQELCLLLERAKDPSVAGLVITSHTNHESPAGNEINKQREESIHTRRVIGGVTGQSLGSSDVLALFRAY
jgi:hypothetical protein